MLLAMEFFENCQLNHIHWTKHIIINKIMENQIRGLLKCSKSDHEEEIIVFASSSSNIYVYICAGVYRYMCVSVPVPMIKVYITYSLA